MVDKKFKALPTNWIGLIKGAEYFDVEPGSNTQKLNCCWKWPNEDGVNFSSALEAIEYLATATSAITSSYHGCIAAFLSGIPFTIAGYVERNRYFTKHYSLQTELNMSSANLRKYNDINNIYNSNFNHMLLRARKNLP